LPFLLVDLIDCAGGARSSRQDEENGLAERAEHVTAGNWLPALLASMDVRFRNRKSEALAEAAE
jgi:hypothetical protein